MTITTPHKFTCPARRIPSGDCKCQSQTISAHEIQSDDMLRGRIAAMKSMIAQFQNEIKQLEGNLESRAMRKKSEPSSLEFLKEKIDAGLFTHPHGPVRELVDILMYDHKKARP